MSECYSYDKPQLRVLAGSGESYGGCNFCHNRPARIWVLTGKALEARMCDACREIFIAATNKRNA